MQTLAPARSCTRALKTLRLLARSGVMTTRRDREVLTSYCIDVRREHATTTAQCHAVDNFSGASMKITPPVLGVPHGLADVHVHVP